MPKDEFDPDDPMELIGVSLAGDFDEMAEGLVDDYILMGFDEEALWLLFRNPFYRSTNAVLQAKGEAYVSQLIRRRLLDWANLVANGQSGGHEIEDSQDGGSPTSAS
ncbi:MAG TPA: hypothetical protein V6D17_19235 [Candidatus Obscuribacterales bacterium]